MSGPDVWGPHAWKFLHFVTLGYPNKPTEKDKKKYKLFFMLLQDTLPCSICARHFGENLKKKPLSDNDLASKENLIYWLIDFHNVVNKMKDKKVYNREEAVNLLLTNFGEKNKKIDIKKDKYSKSNKKSNIMFLIIFLVIIIFVIFMFYKSKKK